MQYTQDHLTEFLNHGNGYIDDPIDWIGSLVVLILKNKQKIQSMMVTGGYELKKYENHDCTGTGTVQTTIIYSRTCTQGDSWADWYVEEKIA
jgi:hypothetical protein